MREENILEGIKSVPGIDASSIDITRTEDGKLVVSFSEESRPKAKDPILNEGSVIGGGVFRAGDRELRRNTANEAMREVRKTAGALHESRNMYGEELPEFAAILNGKACKDAEDAFKALNPCNKSVSYVTNELSKRSDSLISSEAKKSQEEVLAKAAEENVVNNRKFKKTLDEAVVNMRKASVAKMEAKCDEDESVFAKANDVSEGAREAFKSLKPSLGGIISEEMINAAIKGFEKAEEIRKATEARKELREMNPKIEAEVAAEAEGYRKAKDSKLAKDLESVLDAGAERYNKGTGQEYDEYPEGETVQFYKDANTRRYGREVKLDESRKTSTITPTRTSHYRDEVETTDKPEEDLTSERINVKGTAKDNDVSYDRSKIMHIKNALEAQRVGNVQAFSTGLSEKVIKDMLQSMMKSNPNPTLKLSQGQKQYAGFFVGQVMAKGKADPKTVNEILSSLIKEFKENIKDEVVSTKVIDTPGEKTWPVKRSWTSTVDYDVDYDNFAKYGTKPERKEELENQFNHFKKVLDEVKREAKIEKNFKIGTGSYNFKEALKKFDISDTKIDSWTENTTLKWENQGSQAKTAKPRTMAEAVKARNNQIEESGSDNLLLKHTRVVPSLGIKDQKATISKDRDSGRLDLGRDKLNSEEYQGLEKVLAPDPFSEMPVSKVSHSEPPAGTIREEVKAVIKSNSSKNRIPVENYNVSLSTKLNRFVSTVKGAVKELIQ